MPRFYLFKHGCVSSERPDQQVAPCFMSSITRGVSRVRREVSLSNVYQMSTKCVSGNPQLLSKCEIEDTSTTPLSTVYHNEHYITG